MIEIAISIAIVGFALVAVIGVLPAGMNTQRDNREETMVNQDAQYLIESLTHGVKQTGYLSNVVSRIEWWGTNGPNLQPYPSGGAPIQTFTGPFYNEQVIGLLSVPFGFLTNGSQVASVRAVMRSMNGAATVGWSPTVNDSQDLALWYVVDVQIQPSLTIHPAPQNSSDTATQADMLAVTRANLHEVRTTFRWPSNPDGSVVGNNRLVFRSSVAGEIVGVGVSGGAPLFSIRPYTLKTPPGVP
jgi:type II secretory pathway pseudopilin PulG